MDSGLIHILVVSGAHLHFLERLSFWIPERGRLILCTIYCWLTGFGAPVVRALIRRVCSNLFRSWAWTPLQVEAKTTLLLLMIHPQWLVSRSFLMSWMCALALQAPLPLPKWRPLNMSLKCYLFLFPFCAASPLSILWNSLVGPAVGGILFPASLAAIALPWIQPATDQIWRVFLAVLELGPKGPPVDDGFHILTIWWIPMVVHAGLLYGEWKWRREHAFSC
ncbi:MAG: hypothetical protein HC902_02985 [Calothrix sp. SM1_5_4]|nr:hypothetical protein [Calothrix sp. SM1_5_4]